MSLVITDGQGLRKHLGGEKPYPTVVIVTSGVCTFVCTEMVIIKNKSNISKFICIAIVVKKTSLSFPPCSLLTLIK